MKNNTEISDPSQHGSGAVTSRLKAATQKIAELEEKIEATLENDIQRLEKTSKNMDQAFGNFAKKHGMLYGAIILVVVIVALVFISSLTANYYSPK